MFARLVIKNLNFFQQVTKAVVSGTREVMGAGLGVMEVGLEDTEVALGEGMEEVLGVQD